ncbi:MAG TPA: carboxypeptidase-like regulatory domain-containing protein [Candidatus Aquilonibacter sp.]|nr:carboxypeptidase-like regulatory domain-containing protein [Candidatus Aquilonibacter sp.]
MTMITWGSFETIGNGVPVRVSARRVAAAVLAVLWILTGCCLTAGAQQNTADVVGTVTDVSGAVVPNASVTLTNTGTGIVQTLETSGSGDYDFTLVQVGNYNIKVTAKGFKTFVAPDFAVSAGDRARIDAKLQVGETTQTVEVSGAVAPALQTDTSSLATLVTSQAVEDVPLNGRNITMLLRLSPGAEEGSTNDILSGTRPDDRRQATALVVNGQSADINNNLVDGMDNNERVIGGNVARPSVEFIQEANLVTNNYDASIGKTGGAVLDIVTKSGTNSLHGSLYEFFRNKVLNTNPGYSFPSNSTGGMTPVPPNPPYQQNQWGASIGGPIKKDKTFFFADFEKLKLAEGLSGLAASTVPTLCNRGSTLAALQGYTGAITCPDGTSPTLPGDFSDTPTISQVGGSASACTSATYSAGSSTCPFVTIPGTSIAPLGLAYFSMFPVPNCTNTTNISTCNSYTTPSAIQRQHQETIDGRIDQHFSDTNTLYVRYDINDSVTQIPPDFPNVTINPATGYPEAAGATGGVTVNPGAPGFGGVNGFPGFNYTRGQQLAVSFVHVFNPNVILNLKTAYSRLAIRSLPINQNTNASNKLGFQCSTTPNALSSGGNCINGPGLAFANALAVVTLTNYQVLGDSPFVPLLEFDNDFQYAGQLVWNKGPHSIKIGLSVIRRRAAIGQSPSPNGAFALTGIFTGEPAGDLLEGLVDGGVSEGGQPAALHSYTLWEGGYEFWEPTTYIQDDWRAKHWLTLNLGMRYDIFTPFVERGDRITNYDQATGLIVGPGIPGAQRSGRTAGLITPYLDIAPRFGFAATIKPSLVIRGGAGLTFFPINYSSNFSLKNAPGNYNANCLPQNETNTNTVCQAPFASSAIANYGPCPYVTTNNTSGICQTPGPNEAANSASSVGQTGGSLLVAGAPVPITNVNLVYAPSPAQCYIDTSSAHLPYSQTCPAATDPYQSYSINSAQPFNALNEYLEQANLNVEKAFGANVLTVGVVSELGRHATVSNFNLQALSNPFEKGVLPLTNEFPWLGKTSSILEYAPWGSTSYNALQATFVRRFSQGLTTSINYTWAQDLSFTGTPCTPTQTAAAVNQTPNGPVDVPAAINPCYFDNPASPSNPIIINYWNKGGYNNSNASNSRDRVAYTANYQLPWAKSAAGLEGAVAKGWALNLAGFWSTGLPFTVGQTDNTTGLGSTGNPDQICSGKISNHTHLQWFNAGCFVHQYASNTFGDEHGGQVFGPHLQRVDFSLFKEFPLNERFRLQFRTEIFNLFNHPDFNNPTSSISQFAGGTTGSAAAGKTGLNANANPASVPVGAITSLNSNFNSRQVQFALKVLF